MRCFFSPAPPRFVSRLESACLIEGEDIQFSCSTFTTPLPRIRYRSTELTAVVALRFCNYCVSWMQRCLHLTGGWRMAKSWLSSRNTWLWMMHGAGSCLWPSSGQLKQILGSTSVRYKTRIVHVWTQPVSLISALSLCDNVWKCFILFSFGMNLVASSARQVYAPPMSPRLTVRMTNRRTYLLKVWQSEPQKLISST